MENEGNKALTPFMQNPTAAQQTQADSSNKEVSKEEKEDWSDGPNGTRQAKLSTGETVTMEKAYGQHVMDAAAVVGSDTKKLQAAIMAQVVSIDGRPIVFEELATLPMKDYLLIMGEFAAQNF